MNGCFFDSAHVTRQPRAVCCLVSRMPRSYSAGRIPTIVNLDVWFNCSSVMEERPTPNLSRRIPPRSRASTSPDGGSSTSCQPTHRAFEKTCGSIFWGVYPFFFAAPCAWLAAAASAGEVAGLAETRWTAGGLERKERRTSAMPGRLGAWLWTQAHCSRIGDCGRVLTFAPYWRKS